MLELQFFDSLDPEHRPPDREESVKEIVRRIQAIVIPTGTDPFDPDGSIRRKYRQTLSPSVPVNGEVHTDEKSPPPAGEG